VAIVAPRARSIAILRAMKFPTTVILVLLLVQTAAVQRQPAPSGSADWPMYRHDYAGTGASPLAEINAGNVAKLARVWTYGLQGDAAAAPNSEATPIVVGGVMYLPAANRVVALNPDTGQEMWRYSLTGGAPSRRGVAYWPGEGAAPPRIIFTAGRRLIALDARTGRADAQFGTNGEVDMGVPYNSVPLVYKNLVIVGANNPPGAPGGIGNPRAFDARTGAKLWEFSAVAQPGDIGHDTWEGDSWKGRLGANAWPFYFTLDEQRGLLFIPLASPIPGSYGGDRKGANLFGNSVVAVDVSTGKYKWHFQTIHHDLWDADPPAPPALFDVVQNGRTVPALGVTTKSGYLYILNRETGRPLFGVEERPVPKSDAPGELAYPTQPFPVKPPPIARVSYTAADLVTAADTTPEHAAACAALVEKLGGVANAGPFTPWGYRAEGAKTPTTLVFPGGLGGANWGGIAFDARSGNVIVATEDVGALGWIEKTRDGSPAPYDKSTPERSGSARGAFDVRVGGSALPLPCQKPPWGRLLAINAATGNVSWQVPLGVTDDLPAAKQQTGRPAMAGAIVTASGLLFIGSTDDNRFRAFDARTGKELWVTKLDKRGNADPITYQGRNGKQHVAIVATDTLAVYAVQ
jgi:quinoprotein glucose dehydrogenase